MTAPPFGATPGLPVPPEEFERLVWAEADGDVSADERAVLEANPVAWRTTLYRLLDDTDDALGAARRIAGEERAQVVADFEAELARLEAALVRLVGPVEAGDGVRARSATGDGSAAAGDDALAGLAVPVGVAQLQLSWTAGQIVAWASGPGAEPDDEDALRARLGASGAPGSVWESASPVPLPDGRHAPALGAPVGAVLGWLVALGAERDGGADIGPSARWLGRIAVAAVRTVGQGRMVPQVRRSPKPAGGGRTGRALFELRWTPAVVDSDELARFGKTRPGAAGVLETGPDARTFARNALADMVDAIGRSAAARLEVPAAPAQAKTHAEVADALLARLDGSEFEAPERTGAELARRFDQWARPVTRPAVEPLVVQLSPPDSGGAWHLGVLAPAADGGLEPLEAAFASATEAQRRELADQLGRVERLVPVLLRPSGRRGEVVVSQDEAWELMTDTGPALTAAGFDVRVPALSRRRPGPALRLTTESETETVVGAQQLTAVRWSAVFDDVELDAGDIARLAAQARPLVQSRGQWVALDHADLAEAAAALAERADTTQLTGAEMLRHALGLEGTPISGGVSLAGGGWAQDLLASAASVPAAPDPTPEGFVGELRSYQAEAAAWLGFLDEAGLGGCLALDMGLGKTPTVLAHLRTSKRERPALVIAPPAVVGNWAAEAARFTPDLRVVVHHGASRASAEEFAAEVADADVLLTTYGTAVRDVESLAKLEWDHLVLDEAQVIKNPTSETAQRLRQVQARTRVALTGTPIENGLGDLWAILDFTNPGLVGPRAPFVAQLSRPGDAKGAAESALRALNGILVFRRTKSEPAIAAELPDRIDELDHCTMTAEQIGLYQAVLDDLVRDTAEDRPGPARKGRVLAAITALKQICNHPAAYQADDEGLAGRSGKLARLEEIVDQVFAADERVLIFTHFAQWGEQLARHLTERTGKKIACYHGGLARGARDRMIEEFQSGEGAGALVLSLKAGGTGLNLTAASHVVLYDRWWNPAVEDQARDRAWRIGQTRTVIAHRLVCPGTVDERVEEVVAGKRRVADLVLPKQSSIGDLDADQLRVALGLQPEALLADEALPGDGALDPVGAGEGAS